MVLAIVIGAVAGIAGFLPLVGSLQLAKRATRTSNLGHAGSLLLGVLGSFLILAVAAIACIVVARDSAVPFVLSEAIALSAAAVVYGLSRLVRK